MSEPTTDIDVATQEAIRLAQDGQTAIAEKRMLGTVQDAETRHGKGSQIHTTALNALGTFLLSVGQLDQAVEALRAAVAGSEPQEDEGRRDRLTYMTNLGTALACAGKPAEAEQVLRQGLEGRRALYGIDHAGYAFGLEPLADVLLCQGQVDEALEIIDEALAIFMRNAHPRIASSLALRSFILKSARNAAPSFSNLDELPDGMIEQIAHAVVGRVEQMEPLVVRQVLADLMPLLESRLGEDHPLVLNTLATVANLERNLGDEGNAAAWQLAIKKVVAILDRQGQPEQALQAILGLALAQSEIGLQGDALASYQDAVSRAKGLGVARLQAQVLRNYGLFLADIDQRQEAEDQLRLALKKAALAIDTELLGRCQVALGIFLQHGGQQDEAQQQIADALKLLDPAHPDTLCARSHLRALESGSACGCGDQYIAFAEEFNEFVQARLPADLLDRLDVEPKDGGFGIQVTLKREPTEEELRRLDRAINCATEQFQRRVMGRPQVIWSR